ncbi:zf-HC2 domain-containing protein [Phytohabitans flavus]|uniref:Membrane protein n=1 Tax=Phytohabitans flavus TaxID=1076124 RepID=A0A6F8XNE1_9ACTN|nr:zf-HC2 domain-containing protein [Phytohabitans flavus]BCB75345.1 membrane protein [Phytohabitans flavus]
MGCEHFRESLSVRLDGEESLAEREATDAHLAGCVACRDWFDAAARVTRLMRTAPAPTGIAVDDTVLEAAPGPRRARLSAALRILLGAFGLAQFLLGAAQIGGSAATQHLHAAGAGAGGHLWHESAAWNLAVAAGFAWIALRRTRPTGIVPTLTAFVGALTLLTMNDLIAGRVDLTRVLSHSIIVAGYAIILVMSRLGIGPGEPPAGRGDRRDRWRASFDPEPETAPARPTLRLVPGQLRATGAVHARADDRWAA